MIKNDVWIEKFCDKGGIFPYDTNCINCSSYDVKLGAHWLYPLYQKGATNKTQTLIESFSEAFVLKPGASVLATTLEFFKFPRDVCGDFKLKSSIGRQFLSHALAGWIDAGFSGTITLELHNIGPNSFVLEKNMRIGQVVFVQMESPPSVAYGEKGRGRYQNQVGTTAFIKK